MISDDQNPFITQALQGGFSIFEYFSVPSFITSKIDTVESLRIQYTTKLYIDSGYKMKQSFYILLFKFAQYLVLSFTVMYGSGLIFFLA